MKSTPMKKGYIYLQYTFALVFSLSTLIALIFNSAVSTLFWTLATILTLPATRAYTQKRIPRFTKRIAISTLVISVFFGLITFQTNASTFTSQTPSVIQESHETQTTNTDTASNANTNTDEVTNTVTNINTAPTTVVESTPTATSPNGTYKNVDNVNVSRPYVAPSKPSGASAKCRDGSYSFSTHRSGTCSHHGGVAEWY